MTELLISNLQKHGIAIMDMRGQGPSTSALRSSKSTAVFFSVLYNTPTIKDMDTAALTRDCATLERALTYGDSRDIDAKDLCNELKVLSRRLDSEAKPLDALEYISRHQMASLYPNAFVAQRVLLTLPVTVASGERTFSKLKLIKNDLRSTMSQERLNGLATISIDHELSYEINLQQAVHAFAASSQTRVAETSLSYQPCGLPLACL
ncbi:hypothetical protein J4Q44_G00309860 [Coregonus suidteri]|uniref:HAT C-terminal dimerisation domain-containing protein n=1 Tax=Coregonus suidteri TaxID=861788 RepID=A0AAN8L0F1_9TELE